MLLILLLSANLALAQVTGTATVSGAVTDNSGATVPGAKVTILNTATGVAVTTATTPEGTYYIPSLNPGSYRLTIEAASFKQYNREGIVLYTPGMQVVNGQHAMGQRQRAFGMTIDGVNGKEPVLGNPNDVFRIQSASLDMIQEFKVWTTGAPAEFGHSAGGLLSGVFRSGTNSFHGSLEDLRNPAHAL